MINTLLRLRIHLYSWVERGTVRVKCLAQQHLNPGLANTYFITTEGRVSLGIVGYQELRGIKIVCLSRAHHVFVTRDI